MCVPGKLTERESIVVQDVCVHNLKNIDLEISHNALTIVTGVFSTTLRYFPRPRSGTYRKTTSTQPPVQSCRVRRLNGGAERLSGSSRNDTALQRYLRLSSQGMVMLLLPRNWAGGWDPITLSSRYSLPTTIPCLQE